MTMFCVNVFFSFSLKCLKTLHEYILATVSDEVQGMDFLCNVHGESVWLSGQQGHI